MEHTKHIWRAVLLLVLVAIAAIVGRHFMVPASFGDKGFYRYDSLAEFMSKPVIHGDVDSCRSCHQAAFDTEKKGKHTSVSCEVCHGPLAAHARDNAKFADAQIDRSHNLCLKCHQKLRAKPEKYPQIEATEHLVKNGAISEGEPIPEGACIACHDPHSPGGTEPSVEDKGLQQTVNVEK
jgi:hypothetical protein